MRLLLLTGWLVASLIATGLGTLRADDYSGTYTIQGNKGAITLTLQQDDEGNSTGSLKGGDLALQLKGFPQEGGGLLGTATNAQGQFVSYFMVSKVGDRLMLDLIEANADGDPNPDKKSRIPFPITGTAKAPARSTPGDGNADNDDAGNDNVVKENDNAGDDAPPPARNARGAFAGTFKNNELTLESRAAQGNDYTGTIKMAGQTFPFTATELDGTMHGAFTSGNDRFDFSATLQGTKMTLTTGDTEYALQKQGVAQNPLSKPKPPNPLAKPKPANPLAKPAPSKTVPAKNTPAKPPAPTGATTPPKPNNNNAMPGGGPGQSATWKVFKHPIGISVRYPPNWTLKESAEVGGIQLTPPDVTMLQGGPTELYFVTGQGAEGVTSVEDPRLIQYVETQVGQLLPTMRRVGEIEKVHAGTQPGIIMTWEGQAPTGQAMRAQVLGSILKGYAVSIFSIGLKDKLAAREKTIREIAASFAAGAGAKDPQLVGAWKFWSYKSSADGRYGTETTRYFRLMPDGTCVWSNRGESSGMFTGKDSGGNTTWTGGMASQRGDTDQGTWSAGNGQLYVMWKDGSTSTWQYKIGGAPGNRRLFLQGSGKKPDEWVETQ